MKKKYALNNSYFKNSYHDMPKDPLGVIQYVVENGDLPFNYSGENWVYDMFCEYQKRRGVDFEQFLTPDDTAQKMVNILTINLTNPPNNSEIFEIGCGTGQITKYLNNFKHIYAIDVDSRMVDICNYVLNTQSRNCNFSLEKKAFESCYEYGRRFDGIICNPPFSDIPGLLETVHFNLKDEGKAVVLLPKGTFQKERPKKLTQVMSKFEVINQWDMDQDFARTNVKAEISLIQKI